MNLAQYITFKKLETPNTPAWLNVRYKPGQVVYVRTQFGLERAEVLMVSGMYHAHSEGLPARYTVRLHTGDVVEVTREQIAG